MACTVAFFPFLKNKTKTHLLCKKNKELDSDKTDFIQNYYKKEDLSTRLNSE